MPRTFVDLSIYLENDVQSDPPGFGPKIEYLRHDSTAEQIARRLMFRPEAINQIKTAVVEACINASEHSFSPDRKIYQRFQLESDRLVVTISSRGIVPANLNGASSGLETSEAAEERRGWGLKLIRTLMDEVEFERVDDGTSLRMTKYLRQSSS